MKKWVKTLSMILVGAGIWLLYNYFYYGTLEPVGMNLILAIVFGVAMWGIELVFHNKRKE